MPLARLCLFLVFANLCSLGGTSHGWDSLRTKSKDDGVDHTGKYHSSV
jgi:hypothetical protein